MNVCCVWRFSYHIFHSDKWPIKWILIFIECFIQSPISPIYSSWGLTNISILITTCNHFWTHLRKKEALHCIHKSSSLRVDTQIQFFISIKIYIIAVFEYKGVLICDEINMSTGNITNTFLHIKIFRFFFSSESKFFRFPCTVYLPNCIHIYMFAMSVLGARDHVYFYSFIISVIGIYGQAISIHLCTRKSI